MILITGATGQLGTAVIAQLLKTTTTDQFVALARDKNKAESLQKQGVTVRLADFDDPASMEKALQGIDKLLLISTIAENRATQQKNVVDIAKIAGVKHIIYTGVSMKDVSISPIAGFMGSHFETEDHIKASGLTYTFLRNTLYTDVIPMYVGEKVFETGIYLPAGEGKSPYALRSEMGEAAANVLLQSGHENKIYEITGSELYSYADISRELSALSGKSVPYVDADAIQFSENLRQYGVPEFFISLSTGFTEDLKNGQFETVTSSLEELLGRKPASLKTGLRSIYKL